MSGIENPPSVFINTVLFSSLCYFLVVSWEHYFELHIFGTLSPTILKLCTIKTRLEKWIKQEFKVTMFVADYKEIRGLPDKKGTWSS